jgi:hypothetical protein
MKEMENVWKRERDVKIPGGGGVGGLQRLRNPQPAQRGYGFS